MVVVTPPHFFHVFHSLLSNLVSTTAKTKEERNLSTHMQSLHPRNSELGDELKIGSLEGFSAGSSSESKARTK
jgi:hypothetical protein